MRRLLPIVMLISAVACGSPPGGPSGTADLAAAAELAEEQGSYKATMWMSTPVDGGEPMVIKGEGAYDLTAKVAHMEISFVGGTPGAGGGSLSEMETLFDYNDGMVMYMKWPFLSQQLPGAKEWLRMDMQKLGEEMGMDLGALMGAGQSDPSQGLSFLEGTRDVEEVGEEEIRGVNTTHYRAIADFDAVAKDDPEVAATIEKIKEMSGLSEVPMEVWLDAEGLPRRVSMVYDYNPPPDAPAGTPEGKMKMSMDFYDYGTEVDVTFPPADKVADMAELMGR